LLPVGLYDAVIPVPLHPYKLKQRGFNQSAVIAESLSAHIQAECVTTLLKRKKNTVSQTTLSREERQENVKNAFMTERDVTGETFLLVDDVITTGATLNSCAETLKKQGAARVDIAALATPTDILQENWETGVSTI